MAIVDFITELFCRVDDAMQDVPSHAQESLAPSELVTIGLLYAIKGGGTRAFYRWLRANHLALFPTLPERTPPLPSPSHPPRVDGPLPGHADPARPHRHLRDRVAPSGTRRA